MSLTDDELIELVRSKLQPGQYVEPARLDLVEEAERIIGFPIPPLLRRLYLEVSNGAFGPSNEMLGVQGSLYGDTFEDITDIYRNGPHDPTGVIPVGMVIVFEWPGLPVSWMDFRDSRGPMWGQDEDAFFPEDMYFAEWLERGLKGTLRPPNGSDHPDATILPFADNM